MPDISSAEQVQLKQFQDLGEAVTQFCPEFVVGKKKERDDRDPDLRHHRVPAGAKETLDLEILLDPLEEQLHLPSLPVDIGNGASGKMRDIGEKHVVLSGFPVAIANPSELNGAVFSFGTGQFDRLVRSHSLCYEDGIAVHDPSLDPPLHPGDKEDIPLCELIEPGKIEVRSVYNHDGERSGMCRWK